MTLERRTGLRGMSDKRRQELAAAGNAAPFSTFTNTGAGLSRTAAERDVKPHAVRIDLTFDPNGPLVQGRRHVNSMPDDLRAVISQLEVGGWEPAGHLMSASMRRGLAFRMLPDKVRFLLSCTPREDGCWGWLGSHNGKGYAQFKYRGQGGYGHRAAYQMFVAPIPVEMTVDHLCHNQSTSCVGGDNCPHRRCVNPGHLEVVPGVENYRRGANAKKRCRNGHELTPENRMARAKCRLCFENNIEVGSDRVRLSLAKEGRAAARAKLSDADITTMRQMKDSGKRVVDIAKLFNVSAKYASALMSGRRVRRRRHTGPTPAVSRIVRRRSGGLCEFAGCSKVAVHIHHRRPRRMGGSMAIESNLPANLMHLCAADHDWIEMNRAEALSMGLLLHAAADSAAVPVLTRHHPQPVLLDDHGRVLPAISPNRNHTETAEVAA